MEPTMAVSAKVAMEISSCSRMEGQASLMTVRVTWRSPSSRREEGELEWLDAPAGAEAGSCAVLP